MRVFGFVKHPTYSAQLAPSDCLFQKQKTHFEGKSFLTNDKVICAVEEWYAEQNTRTF